MNELRYIPGFIEVPSDEPGLVQALNGDVILVKRDGTRVVLPGGGGSGGTVIQQDGDPGAVGAGTFWLNTTDPGNGVPATVKPVLVRNEADTGWVEQGLIHYNGDGNLSSFVTLDDGSVVVEGHDAGGISNGVLAIYGGGGGSVFLKGRDTYLQQRAGDAVYFYLGDQPFWFKNAGASSVWGISAPSGAEKFVSIDPPDPAEIIANQRLHWFDGATTALRFIQKDTFGAATEGRSAGIVGLVNGTLRIGQIGNNESFTADDGTNYGTMNAGQWVLGLDAGDDNSEVYSAGLGHGIVSQPTAVPLAAFIASNLAGATVALDTGNMAINLGDGDINAVNGELLIDNFTNFAEVKGGGVIAGSDIGGVNAETYSMRVGHGIHSNPAAGVPAFTAQTLAGGTVALDCGTLAIVNLPTADPHIAGALWNSAGTPAISAG